MAGVTRRLNILVVDESVLHVDVSRMAGMARDTSSGVGIGSLPAGQELVPVIIPACTLTSAVFSAWSRHLLFGRKAALGYILVALEAILIPNREVHDGRLDGGPRKPHEGVPGTHQFSLHPPRNARPGMTVDAQAALRGVE